jgi:hypothetical protein
VNSMLCNDAGTLQEQQRMEWLDVIWSMDEKSHFQAENDLTPFGASPPGSKKNEHDVGTAQTNQNHGAAAAAASLVEPSLG